MKNFIKSIFMSKTNNKPANKPKKVFTKIEIESPKEEPVAIADNLEPGMEMPTILGESDQPSFKMDPLEVLVDEKNVKI